MKRLGTKTEVTEQDVAGDKDGTQWRETFEITEADVGRLMPNFRGHARETVQFSSPDVGRTITLYTIGDHWRWWTWD
jgi:hypothetical protein